MIVKKIGCSKTCLEKSRVLYALTDAVDTVYNDTGFDNTLLITVLMD